MDLNICSVITIKFKILKFPDNMFAVIPGVKNAAANVRENVNLSVQLFAVGRRAIPGRGAPAGDAGRGAGAG